MLQYAYDRFSGGSTTISTPPRNRRPRPSSGSRSRQPHALGRRVRLAIEFQRRGPAGDRSRVRHYWSPANPVVVPQPLRTSFADGGSLENTGIGGMLVYEDIDALIAFVNSMQPLVLGQAASPAATASPIRASRSSSTMRFRRCSLSAVPERAAGPQDNGYVPYAGATSPTNPTFANNQVFPSAAFQGLSTEHLAGERRRHQRQSGDLRADAGGATERLVRHQGQSGR